MLFPFLCGFVSAFVVLGSVIVWGARKGRETLDKRLRELQSEHERSVKAIKAASTLDVVKTTSLVQLHVPSLHETGKMVPAKFVMVGPTITVSLVTEEPPTAAAPSPEGATKETFLGKINAKDVSVVVDKTKTFGASSSPVLQLSSCNPAVSPMVLANPDVANRGWVTLMVRFPTVRDTERWTNLLQPTERTTQWKTFAKSLPQLDVLNVFISRIFFENSSTPELKRLIKKKLNKKFAKIKPPGGPGSRISLEEVDPGRELPLFTNVSFISYSACGELGFDFDLHYRGGFFLQVCIALEVRGVTLPAIIFSVTIKEIKGRMHMSVGPPPSDKMWLGFHDKPTVQLQVEQEVHTSKENIVLSALASAIPDLSDFVSNAVKVKLFEDMILPNLDDFPLPNVKDTPPNTPTTSAAAEPLNYPKADNNAQLPPRDESSSSNDFIVVDQAKQPTAMSPSTPQQQPSQQPATQAAPQAAAPVHASVAKATATLFRRPSDSQSQVQPEKAKSTPSDPPPDAPAPTKSRDVEPATGTPQPPPSAPPQPQPQPQQQPQQQPPTYAKPPTYQQPQW